MLNTGRGIGKQFLSNHEGASMKSKKRSSSGTQRPEAFYIHRKLEIWRGGQLMVISKAAELRPELEIPVALALTSPEQPLPVVIGIGGKEIGPIDEKYLNPIKAILEMLPELDHPGRRAIWLLLLAIQGLRTWERRLNGNVGSQALRDIKEKLRAENSPQFWSIVAESMVRDYADHPCMEEDGLRIALTRTLCFAKRAYRQ